MASQAERIIEKFGGASRLAVALGCGRGTVHKWTYPRDRGGTDGIIPSTQVGKVKAVAELLAIDLTPEDWNP